MSATLSDPAAPFAFCPKCGEALKDNRCIPCGWTAAPTATAEPSRHKRRRMEWLIALLAVVVLAGAGFNLALNFSTAVEWLPTMVLLWMDDDGKSEASKELNQRLRNDKLSNSQLSSLLTKRLHDPSLLARSPFPVGHEQVLYINQNCRMPADFLSIRVNRWKLSIDGQQSSAAPDEPPVETDTDGENSEQDNPSATKNVRKKTGADTGGQEVELPALEEGTHKIELTGELRVCRLKDRRQTIYSRPVSLSREIEIKGKLTDYAKPRSDKAMLELLRNGSYSHAWWVGDKDEADPGYFLTIGAAMPGVPLIMDISVRVGSKGDFTRVGVFTNRGDTSLIAFNQRYSLKEVPGISEARRIQVRMMPNLASALKGGHKQFFAGCIEWDSITVHHHALGHRPNPMTDEFRPPSRVRAKFGKKKEEPSTKDEEV